MAKRPTITTVDSGYTSQDTINTNFTNVRDQFDNTLSLDGSTPNSMGADLDMNNNDILNAKDVNTTNLYIQGTKVTTSDLVENPYEITKEYDTVATLLADTNTFAVGLYFKVIEGDYTYKSVASGGDVTNAGGQQFKVLAEAGHYNFLAFGADGSGTADVATTLSTALSRIATENTAGGYTLDASGVTSKPWLKLDLGSGIYELGSKVIIDDLNAVEIHGQGAVIKGAFADYLLSLTGNVHRVMFRGIVFECTPTGAVDVNADNISSARVVFEDCRFTGAADKSANETAVAYINRSSTLTFNRCYFNRVKHPVDVENCDFITFNDCWFGFPTFSDYDDKDGYIRCDKGFLRISDCLFAGGPSWYTGKVDGSGAAITQYNEVAYVRMGLEGVEAADEDNGNVVISDTRIGFESGAGPLVNWFVSNKGTIGTEFRSGVTLKNIITAPREEKITDLDGTDRAPLIRLFEMPHVIDIDGVMGTQGNLALIAPGSTTSLSALRAQAPTQVDFQTDLAQQMEPGASFYYSVKNALSSNVTMTVESGGTYTENSRWLELFGAFDYFFPSNSFFPDTSSSNTTLEKVVTFFSDFSTDRRAAVFEVLGGARSNVSSSNNVDQPIYGYITVARDETSTDTIFAQYTEVAAVNSSVTPQITVRGMLSTDGGTTTSASIATASAANAQIVIELEHGSNPGVANIRCAGLCVRPLVSRFARQDQQQMIQSFWQ